MSDISLPRSENGLNPSRLRSPTCGLNESAPDNSDVSYVPASNLLSRFGWRWKFFKLPAS